MCVLGKRLLKDININNCSKEIDQPLWNTFCELKNNTNDREYTRNPDSYRSKGKNWQCDSYFQGSLRLYRDYYSISAEEKKDKDCLEIDIVMETF